MRQSILARPYLGLVVTHMTFLCVQSVPFHVRCALTRHHNPIVSGIQLMNRALPMTTRSYSGTLEVTDATSRVTIAGHLMQQRASTFIMVSCSSTPSLGTSNNETEGRFTDAVSRLIVNPVIDLVDVEAVSRRIDVEELSRRIDVSHMIQCIGMMKDVVDRIDWNAVLERVDVERVVQRANLHAMVARSTNSILANMLDTLRAQVIRFDLVLHDLFRPCRRATKQRVTTRHIEPSRVLGALPTWPSLREDDVRVLFRERLRI